MLQAFNFFQPAAHGVAFAVMFHHSALSMEADAPPVFRRLGPAQPESPVVIAVPHAGRYYAPALLADAAVPPLRLRQLEDRYAELLITDAVERGATAFVADHARAWIDLNRDPREIDPAMITGPVKSGATISSLRTRHGLGLIPCRVGGGVHLWRRRFTADEIETRISAFHQPYHDAIGAALRVAQARFGVALLIDCHSMPSIRPLPDLPPAIVIGDRFGRSASAMLSDLVDAVCRQTGLVVSRNAPYAGGYSLDRHGRPHLGIHALQLEIDRKHYLDGALDRPGEGLAEMRALIARLFQTLHAELVSPRAIAAE